MEALNKKNITALSLGFISQQNVTIRTSKYVEFGSCLFIDKVLNHLIAHREDWRGCGVQEINNKIMWKFDSKTTSTKLMIASATVATSDFQQVQDTNPVGFNTQKKAGNAYLLQRTTVSTFQGSFPQI